MDLGIVVVSYNTKALTANCLDSIYACLQNSSLTFHVWVIDNASSDGSPAIIAERFPQATLVASQENLGFARGTNVGLDCLSALDTPPRYVLLLNPDTLVSEGALPLMANFLDEHPRAGVVGASLRYGDGRFQHSAFRFPTLCMAVLDFWPLNYRLLDSGLNGRYARRLYAAGEPFAIDHPLGAAMMVRWETIEQVGPLDGDYFMYCEEIDWCLRIKQAGWQVYCVPQAKITHFEGQSTRQFREQMLVALWQSRYRLFAKHYGRLYQLLARATVRAGMRHLIRQTERCLRQGTVTPQEGQRRILAYQRVKTL